MGGNPARSFSLLGAWARQSATLFCTAYSRSAPADMCHELQKSKRVGRERCTHAATMWIYGMRFWYRYMKSWPFLVCLGFLCAMAAGAPVDAFGKVLLTDVPVWQVDFRRRWRVQVVSSLFFVFFFVLIDESWWKGCRVPAVKSGAGCIEHSCRKWPGRPRLFHDLAEFGGPKVPVPGWVGGIWFFFVKLKSS